MRCNKAQEFLSLDLDGALPPDATLDLQSHLDDCPDCREYREDLQLGSRLLAATEPSLPDNFDWKLQLRLNQTLKEAAGEVAYPWTEEPADHWTWARNFGAAAAVGLAAVLAFAVFVGPMGDTPSPVPATQPMIFGQDRLPLENHFSVGSRLGRPVSTNSPFQATPVSARGLDRGWSGQNLEDLRTIHRLRAENENLGKRLFLTQRELQLMQARLDSTEDKALDLQEGRR